MIYGEGIDTVNEKYNINFKWPMFQFRDFKTSLRRNKSFDEVYLLQ